MILELIHDRTEADSDRLEALAQLIDRVSWDGLTPEQKAQWTAAQKGAYNHTDRNRVGGAVEYLAARLAAAGYVVPVAPKTDWTVSDIPTPAQMARYLADVAAIRAALAVRPGTPAVPGDMDGLTVQEANDIEKIFVDVEEQLKLMIAAYWYTNELYMGEVTG